MVPKELEEQLYFIIIAVLHDDEDALIEMGESLRKHVSGVYTFNEAGVLSINSGLRFEFHDHSHLHAEITH